MRALTVGCLILALTARTAAGQAGQDSHPRSPELREQIERRFAEKVKEELRLTDEQATRLKAVAKEHGGERRKLRERERSLRDALDGQIRDGATADQDSVAKLTRNLLDLRVQYAESWRREMREMGFLTPEQRARLLVMREKLLQRVHEMRKDHRGFRRHGDGH